MYCPLDVNTGFVQLKGPISATDLNAITVKSYPLTISFAPRTTIPSLIGNRIDESTENTCTYKGKRYNLVDVQLCSVANKGYLLPGESRPPVAELIMTFSPSSPPADIQELSGVLLCVPIYDSGTPSHAEYLTQLIDQTVPSCKYTNLVGSDYEGADYQQIPNSSLTSCVKTCCGDTKCLAYTFRTGTCYLKDSIPAIKKGLDKSIISGTVDHNLPSTGATSSTCAVPVSSTKKKTDAHVTTLESFFYSSSSDTSQTSFAYKTCIETVDKDGQPTSKSLYVVVFPRGAQLTQAGYQQLLLQLQGTLLPYSVPPAIRGAESTVKSYEFDEDGEKVATEFSKDGVIYATQLSTCTDDFRNRFEYFTQPPLLPVSSRYGGVSQSAAGAEGQCPYYKTSQYKCVPFNQLTDLSGNYVIPGTKTLETIAYEQEQKKEKQKKGDSSNGSLSTETMEVAIGSIVGGAIACVLLFKAGTWLASIKSAE